MSLTEFQRVLLKLYTSPSFCIASKMDFKNNLLGYNLSEAEVDALSQLTTVKDSTQPQIEDFNNYIYSRKCYGVWNEFRTLNSFFNSFQQEIMTNFREYYEFQDINELDFLDYFANFIYELYSSSLNPITQCLKEAVKYDLIISKAPLMNLSSLKYSKNNVQTLTETFSFSGTSEFLYIMKSPSVMIESFNYNIPALYEGVDINDLEIQPSIFAFILLDIQTVQVCRLSPSLQFLINQAETPTSISQLIKEAASFHNLTNISEQFQQTYTGFIQKLCEKRIFVEL